ncbi:MFS transporter [Chloroflexota bacterium]
MTATTGRKPRYFYGWNIVAASFLAHLAYAEHHSSLLGLFFRPLQREFGWSRSALAAVQAIARATEALAAPFVGPMIDRYGPRVLMPVGAIIIGFAMLGVTQINALWQFYLLRGLVVAIGFTLMGGMVTDVTVNKWFTQRRGRAIAIGRAGNSLSNAIMTPLTVFVIAASGWRTMFIIFAVVTWLVVLIPSAILMRRRPEDMGLYPDGIYPGTNDTTNIEEGKKAHPTSEAALASEPVWSRQEALKTRSFWLLAGSFGISSMAFQSINISLAPYIQDLGYGDAMLAAVLTSRAIFMVVILLLAGFFAEYAHRVHIRVIPFIIQGVGIFLFLLAGEPTLLWLAVTVYTLGLSGVQVTQEVVWANFFGRHSLGLVRSMGYFAAFGLGAIGPIAMNAVYDIRGSYQLAFLTFVGLSAAAAFLMLWARPPKAKRHATATE